MNHSIKIFFISIQRNDLLLTHLRYLSTIKYYIVSSLYQSESSLKSKYLINYVINNQSIVTMFYHQMNETLSPF